jgi:hypothetical protein
MAAWLRLRSPDQVGKNGVTARQNAYPFQHNGHPCGRRCHRSAYILRVLRERGFFQGAERFEEAQGDIPMPRILAHQQGHFLPKNGQVERPVDQQQHPTGLPPMPQVVEEEPGHQSKAQQRLHAFGHHHGALQAETSVCPLHQEAFVLAAYGALGPVRAHRHQAQQGVKREATERADVGAGASRVP